MIPETVAAGRVRCSARLGSTGDLLEEPVPGLVVREQIVATPIVPAGLDADPGADEVGKDDVVGRVDQTPRASEPASEAEPPEERGEEQMPGVRPAQHQVAGRGGLAVHLRPEHDEPPKESM